MFDLTQGSPQKIFIRGIVAGLVFGLLFEYFQDPKNIEEESAIAVIIGNLVFSALVASAYFFMFRSLVANVRGDPRERTRFAGVYFLWIGMIIAMESVRFFFGTPLVHTVSMVIFGIVGLSISYRKLLRNYRAAGEGGGGSPPQSPPS